MSMSATSEAPMSRSRSQSPPLPPCYALVHPGLEPIASEEIERDLDGEIKRTGRGLIVFRVPEIDERLLRLRTTEDVYLMAWGTDQLTYRAEDLDKIQRWTAREANWEHLLRLHHAIRPKPKGKPTYRLITQMNGEHGYLRRDARKALGRGLEGKFPASWRPAEENAAVEVWLTLDEATAVCGLRLSDASMRHRTYKLEHRPASLRPTLAAAMVRLAGARPNERVVDPFCGAGTLLAEQLLAWEKFRTAPAPVWGGDVDWAAVRAATFNLRKLGQAVLCKWDARRLPLASGAFHHVLANPPFGKQLASPEEVGPLYRQALLEMDRVLRPGGQAVLLVSDARALQRAVQPIGWQGTRRLTVRILGQAALLSVWRKPA
jgi:tRNA (guanine6-N2)-methyltransferase